MSRAIFGHKSYNFFAGSNERKKQGKKVLQVWVQCLRSYKVTKSYFSWLWDAS